MQNSTNVSKLTNATKSTCAQASKATNAGKATGLVANRLVGAIEAGGTKFVCAVGTCPEDLTRAEFPTTGKPKEVLAQVCQWLLNQQSKRGTLAAIGVGSFGPIDLDKTSPTYGYITTTPKPHWQNTNIVAAIANEFPDIEIAFNTDVNVAALGEAYWGNGQDACGNSLDDLVYITIGTGIGAGVISSGQLVSGLMHPEVGHMLLPRISSDEFIGSCPYHKDCWEGLCSGTALFNRAGISAEKLPATHPSWSLMSQYISYALANIILMMSPKRIILGGSVSKAGLLGQDEFFKQIREQTAKVLNGYITSPLLNNGLTDYIVSPKLGDNAGVCGAMALAQQQLK